MVVKPTRAFQPPHLGLLIGLSWEPAALSPAFFAAFPGCGCLFLREVPRRNGTKKWPALCAKVHPLSPSDLSRQSKVRELQEELALARKSPAAEGLADASELAMMLKAGGLSCGFGLGGRCGQVAPRELGGKKGGKINVRSFVREC